MEIRWTIGMQTMPERSWGEFSNEEIPQNIQMGGIKFVEKGNLYCKVLTRNTGAVIIQSIQKQRIRRAYSKQDTMRHFLQEIPGTFAMHLQREGAHTEGASFGIFQDFRIMLS